MEDEGDEEMEPDEGPTTETTVEVAARAIRTFVTQRDEQ